jgi:branched-chain amino acid transport system substrate-binding protein
MAKNGLATCALSGVALAAMALPALADVNILYLSDMSGPTSVLTGESSQRAIEMAIADFGGEVNGEKVVLNVADHLSKPDVGLGIAREYVDGNKVDLLFSADQSAVALAISDLVRDKNIAFVHGASSTALTNDKCGPNQIQMLMDSYGLSRAITIPLVEAGRKKWYYITVDYAFGQDLQAKGEDRDQAVRRRVRRRGKARAADHRLLGLPARGEVEGRQTIGLATFGTWQMAIGKQAQEFGLDIPLAPYFLGDTDIKAAGLESFQNVQSAIQFYWDQNDKTREFAKRFRSATAARRPSPTRCTTSSSRIT